MQKHLFISGILVIAGFVNLAAQEIKSQNPVLDIIYANEKKRRLVFPRTHSAGDYGIRKFCVHL